MTTKYQKQGPLTGFCHQGKMDKHSWFGHYNDNPDKPLDQEACVRFVLNTEVMRLGFVALTEINGVKQHVLVGQPEQVVIDPEYVDELPLRKGILFANELTPGQFERPVFRTKNYALFLNVNPNGTPYMLMVTDTRTSTGDLLKSAPDAVPYA